MEVRYMPSTAVLEKKKQMVADLSEESRILAQVLLLITRVSMLKMIQNFAENSVKQA